MSTFRPLPARPSLEYARKEAKALLRRLRTGEAEAIARARARHPHLDLTHPPRIRLADAQLVVAREYGFASWPRLVRYLGDIERQQLAHTQLHDGPRLYEAHAQSLLREHGARRAWAGRALAAYVPRFYGQGVEEVFASEIDENDARLAVARTHGAPSWEVLLERLEGNARTRPGDWEVDPMQKAGEAIAAADLSALERVVAAHPELLHPSEYDLSAGRTLMWRVLGQERKHGAAAMRPIVQWLEARGLDRQRELNLRLCGHIGMSAAEVRALLEQGADPNWVAPSGIPVLEHALLRYWNAEAVDVLAARATPRSALWIAAGLGDVEGVQRFLDRQGRPTAAARRLRPDFVAVGGPSFTDSLPFADDEEILVETLLVAMLNQRTNVLEYLASRGAPLDSLIYGVPLINIAVGNTFADAVECLERCGASLDLGGGSPNGTARELARELFERMPQNANCRRILMVCGMDPDAVLAERDARPVATPKLDVMLERALRLAQEDAAYLGQPGVRPENLLIGLMRAGGPPRYLSKEAGRMDVERFHSELADRMAVAEDAAHSPELPIHPEAQAALDAAIGLAAGRRQAAVYGVDLLRALTLTENGSVGAFLARYGVNAAALNKALETAG